MTLKQEVKEIVKNTQEAYRRGEITAEQFCDVTRIPLKDAFLTLYADGEKSTIFVLDIYTPFEMA